ncbi:class I SAM-dependent methyltransferase [Caldicellulosiruptoraceae bacterium PP1]
MLNKYNKLAKYYYEYTSIFNNNKLMYKIINKTLQQINNKKLKILDVGCGTGEVTQKIFKRGFHKITGIDKSFSMIEIARKRNRKIKFIRIDFFKFSTRKKFDVIIVTTDVINHINKQKINDFFKKCYRLLKYNGIIIFDINLYQYLKNISNKRFIKKINNSTIVWDTKRFGNILYIYLLFKTNKNSFLEKYKQYMYSEAYIEKILKYNKFYILSKKYDYKYIINKRSKAFYILAKNNI